MITWRQVESSNVQAVGWDNAGKIMFVRFKNGQVYAYLQVSRQRAVFIASRCTSVGAYLNQVVKPKFPSLRVPELD